MPLSIFPSFMRALAVRYNRASTLLTLLRSLSRHELPFMRALAVRHNRASTLLDSLALVLFMSLSCDVFGYDLPDGHCVHSCVIE